MNSKYLLRRFDKELWKNRSIEWALSEVYIESLLTNLDSRVEENIRNSIMSFATKMSRAQVEGILMLWDTETIIYSLTNAANIDFSKSEFQEARWKDIPIQASETKKAQVLDEYNGTIWVLKYNNKIIFNEEIGKALTNTRFDDISINEALNYQPTNGKPGFRKAVQSLISWEEKRYNWINTITSQRKGGVTQPFFISGWAGGYTIFRDFFLKPWSPVVTGEKRWPNIDEMTRASTKVPMISIDLIGDDGSVNINEIEEVLQKVESQGRNSINFYFNFPNNPTGVQLSEKDCININKLFTRFKNVSINVCIDDPYGAFSIDQRQQTGYQVTTPLSYYLDTDTNVTVVELWSHGTKEAGIYWFRTAVMRVFTREDNVEEMEDKISKALRATHSMTPSIPQDIYTKAILGTSNLHEIEKLSKQEIEVRVQNYLNKRDDIIQIIEENIITLQNSIEEECWDYLIPIKNIQEDIEYRWGFFIGYTLSEVAKQNNITPEDIRIACNSLWINGCGITVIGNVIRITLVSWDSNEFAKRLRNWIEISLKKQ